MDNIIIVNELVEYKGIKFYVKLEYYYDKELNEYYADVELANKNLEKIKKAYEVYKK